MVCLIIMNDLPRDLVKANELYRKAGELGCTMGYYNLDSYYDGTGVERNEKKGKHFFELAAMAGGVALAARHNLIILDVWRERWAIFIEHTNTSYC